MNKKGFTLIELLAVIVILAIIALIATPIVLNIIEETKISSVKRSSELYINALELTLSKAKMDNIDLTTCDKLEDGNLICGENQYKVEINGKNPEYIEVKSTQKGQVSFAMKTDGYCVMQTEDESISYKKIVSSVNNSEIEIKEEMCSLNPYTSSSCFAFDSETGTITDYYYYENNDKTQPPCPKEVVIPKQIANIDVSIIGNRAFVSKQLNSVIIPNTVTKISGASFHKNFIKELIIPEGVTTIEADAFSSNLIEKISLPTTLTSITYSSFTNNKLKEEDAYFYKRNSDGSIDYTTLIGYGGELKDIVIPSEKNGVKLTTIGKNVFHSFGLTSVVIPNTVTKIRGASFHKNYLKELIIPEGVTTIEADAFSSNLIEKISLPTTLTSITYSSFANNKLRQEEAYFYKRNKDGSIDYTTIIGYGGELKDIIIPSEKNGIKLTTIASQAFREHSLTNVEIPNTVTQIQSYAFYINSLKNIEIPSSVIDILNNAFSSNSLETVTIKNKPENVKLGSNAFDTFNTNNIIWEPIE